MKMCAKTSKLLFRLKVKICTATSKAQILEPSWMNKHSNKFAFALDQDRSP